MMHSDFLLERGVAQPGSASGLGPEGRRFESCRPDQKASTAVEAFFISSPRWQRQVFDAPPPGQHLRLRWSLSTDSFCIRSLRLDRTAFKNKSLLPFGNK